MISKRLTVHIVAGLLSVSTLAISQTGTDRTISVTDAAGQQKFYTFHIVAHDPPVPLTYLDEIPDGNPETDLQMLQWFFSAIRNGDKVRFESLWLPVEYEKIRADVDANFREWAGDLAARRLVLLYEVRAPEFSVIRYQLLDANTGSTDAQMVLVTIHKDGQVWLTNEFSTHPVVGYWDDPRDALVVMGP